VLSHGRRVSLLLPVTAAMLMASLFAACRSAAAPSALDRLHPCTSDEGPTDAYCGALTVYEDRQAAAGRTIDLHIVLLPGLSADAAPDPLFFLAGGPGQGAAQLVPYIRDAFRQIQVHRDIVFVDQRGTGESNPLECDPDDESLAAMNAPVEAVLRRLRTCLAGYDADPALYTTPVAIDDLDDVRAFLGYERINLYGGSYGTRAALVYLRRHEAHVRAAVLDGVAPTDMRLPMFFARDAQRALDRLLADCEADAACGAKYPDLAARTRALFEHLEAAPVPARLVHPRTGVAEDVRVDARFLAGAVHGALYSALTSSMVPELLVRAESGDFQGMLALALLNESGAEQMALGMQMSVICAEDAPRIRPQEAERASAGTVFADHLFAGQMEACAFWPTGDVPEGYYDPVVSDVPVLLLSGDVDPVTPPSWADAVASHLSHARHVIAPATGHGVVGTGCGQRMIRDFIAAGTVEGLDASCVAGMSRPAFFLSPAGPDPMAAPAASRAADDAAHQGAR
jgi:pimeloyl-ACP methyl ester carboxylesterase